MTSPLSPSTWSAPVPLRLATDESLYGGKSSQLAAAARAGLPVPEGIALEWRFVDAVAAGDDEALAALHGSTADLQGGRLAVRSSALGEDSAAASFAGQHLTCLNVRGPDGLTEAVRMVRDSAHSAAALAYRERLGLPGRPRVAVVVQELVVPECAGVLFSRDPLDGSDVLVIEASWGLGEAVVSGVVVPDHYRVRRDGRVIERTAGMKDLAVEPAPAGGTSQVPIPADRIHRLCLDDTRLESLRELTARCEQVFGGTQDLEWAFVADGLRLLQRRPMTGAVPPH
ncbi:PEP/pyruvate-binding domain-containing protein [Streptomyces virginiae]|uniref:PEP/pyruvate-binding domain-containing protein n=1 Tax=Streptomyces virginiae TaxID=1961 RepID=UPI0033A462D4